MGVKGEWNGGKIRYKQSVPGLDAPDLATLGADVNARNNDGQTALDWAAKGGYNEIVQLLLDK